MRLVSIKTFIATVYGDDEKPPTPTTIRRRCPDIPGAVRDGHRWMIDLDCYFEVMERRVWGFPEDNQELGFIKSLAKKLK